MPCMLLSAVIAIPVALVLFFVAIFWLPEVLLRAAHDVLGTRLVSGLFGFALVVFGVLLGARLWYVTSTRGRQGGWAGVLLTVGVAVGLIALGGWIALST